MEIFRIFNDGLHRDLFEGWIKILGALGSIGTVISLLYLILVQQRRNNVQQFEASLFNLLSLHNQIVSNLRMKEFDDQDIIFEGRSVFNLARRSIDGLLNIKFEHEPIDNEQSDIGFTLDEARANLEINYNSAYYARFEPLLNHYFRNLYHIFLYIDDSTLIQSYIPFRRNELRYKYAKIVRAQLSQNELFAIMLNLLIQDYGYPKFLKLDKKYNIAKNFRFADVKPIEYFNLYQEMKSSLNRNTENRGVIVN